MTNTAIKTATALLEPFALPECWIVTNTVMKTIDDKAGGYSYLLCTMTNTMMKTLTLQSWGPFRFYISIVHYDLHSEGNTLPSVLEAINLTCIY